jgi:hypothetical protein
VFIGYEEETTKYFRVYSLEYSYMIRYSIVRVNELIKGGIINLWLQGLTGPHGTLNTIADRLVARRLKKDISLVEIPIAKSSLTL